MDRILNMMHSLQIYWNISCRPASSYHCLKDLSRSASSSSSTSCSASQRWRRLLPRLRADALMRALRRTWSCTCDADTVIKMVARDDDGGWAVFQYDPVSYAMNFDDNCSWHHHSHRTGIITMIMPISPRLNINMTHDHTPLAS